MDAMDISCKLRDRLMERGASLVGWGFSAYAKTQKNVKTEQSTKRTDLPRKTVATRAGIGWIGKCAGCVSCKDICPACAYGRAPGRSGI